LTDSVEKLIAISGTVVKPNVTRPAARNRVISSLSCGATTWCTLLLPMKN
jgi:hypothetical protein